VSALDVPEADRVVARMSASATARHDSTITRKTHAIDRATAKWSHVRALLIYSSLKFTCDSTTLLVHYTFGMAVLRMSLQRPPLLPGLDEPEQDRGVPAAGRKMLTVRRKRHRRHVPPAKVTEIQYSCYLLY